MNDKIGLVVAANFAGDTNQGSLWSALFLFLIGLGFLYYGLTRRPLYFNRFNPWKKPLPVWAARLVYIPVALFFFYFALLNAVSALHLESR
jgi:hypothetical protein